MDIIDAEYLDWLNWNTIVCMNVHDLIVIKDYPLATIKAETPKAICVSWQDKNGKWDTWIPKKIIHITKKENTKKRYREVEVFHISLPQWFKDKNQINV